MNLKNLAQALKAIDITDRSLDEIKDIDKVEVVYRRFGKNGMNGLLFSDSKGKFFVISKRNSNLFYFS